MAVCAMHGYFGMGYGWLFQLAVFILFFLVVWWLLKSQKDGQSPGEILKTRLAKGEITKEEYHKLKKEIE